MEVKQINQLMLAMVRTGIDELEYKKADFELKLKRCGKGAIRPMEGFPDSFEENPLKQDFEKHKASSPVEAQKSATAQEAKEDAPGVYVTSPMVGTIYYSPSPNDPAFVKVGDRVEKNTVVCIIEAMKVMNEVKAQVAGVVAEIFIENGSPVEFGSKLFRIIP